MDIIQEPYKRQYDKCKYKVKLWEYNFKKKHGRIPSKLDIREAKQEVRDAYRTYFKLKLDALDERFSGIDGFNSDEDVTEAPKVAQEECSEATLQVKKIDDSVAVDEVKISEGTWGEHLNKKQPATVEKENDKQTSSISSKLTKKLFNTHKFNKRNPRKSLSFTQKKTEAKSNSEQPQFLSQPSTSTSSQLLLSQTTEEEDTATKNIADALFENERFKILDCPQNVQTKAVNIAQSLLEEKSKPLRSFDSGWLSRAAKDTGVFINVTQPVQKCSDVGISKESTTENLGYESDEIIDESDCEDSCSLLHVAKKQKVESLIERKENFPSNNKIDVIIENAVCDPITKIKSPEKIQKENKTERKSQRKSKMRMVLVNDEESEEDPFNTDNEDDPDFNLPESENKVHAEERKTTKPEKSKTKSKTSKKKNLSNDTTKKRKRTKTIEPTANNTTSEPYELEYSIKPRIKTVPRINIKKVVKQSQNKPKHSQPIRNIKSEIKQKQLEKRIAAGKLNENFVTINIQKKVFVRGKKSMNFSTYKKKQWKARKKALCGPDMDMGGCDGGTLVCFVCGEEGHFARQCKVEGDGLLPHDAKDDDPHLTLEEASQIASETTAGESRENAEREEKIVDETDVRADEAESRGNENDEVKKLLDSSDDDILVKETDKLEEFLKIDIRHYLDDFRVVKPIYDTNPDGNLIDIPDEVFQVLSKFGHSSFRPGQETAIMRILSGKSTLVTLSTGSGKSLCYQLPAYLYSKRAHCVTLVISPLVSLMEDQVTGIPSFLKAACLHTNQTKVQRQKVMDRINSEELDVLLVSPEAVVAGERSKGFGSLLRKLPPIAFACVDEAHCVSQWSHNFRPSYLMLCKVLRDRLGVKTILGLTATATNATIDSIIRHFGIEDGTHGVIRDKPVPDNICLSVSKDTERDRALLGLLFSERFVNCESIIVYCTRRDECERVAGYLRTCFMSKLSRNEESKKKRRINVEAEPYHAGLSASRRRTIQKAFMSGELRIVVATVAFGMGINKSNIRSVIHYNMPMSFESYVQEIGRAGRDGLPAHCHLFLDSKGKDNNELRRHVFANSLDRHVLRKLLHKIFIPCSCKQSCTRHEVAFSIQETVSALDVPEENISTLLCYLELHQNQYVEVLSPAYVKCKLISYNGAIQIKRAAKDCPPLAVALALDKTWKEGNVFEFPVIEVAASMGWDSGICKHKLKNLEWTTVKGLQKRSTLTVEFSDLGFRLLAPGNLTEIQLDEALDSLYERVRSQERTALLQLQAIHSALKEAAENSFDLCVAESNRMKCDEVLKSKIREYFEEINPLEKVVLEEIGEFNEDLIVGDVRALVCMYKDTTFTGRAVARIFHGVQSPNYPAVIWGRCKFWRSHIDADFNKLCQIATREILKLK